MKFANFVVAMVGLACLWAVPAVAWDEFPALSSGRHYSGSGVWGERPRIEACLRELSQASEANYYAALVNNTSLLGSASDNDAVPYVDALTTAWSSQLRPDLDVVMVLGIENRAVAIHPGSTWVRLGFETTVIKDTIDSSTFKNFARSQDYDGAVCALAQAVEQRLVRLKAAEVRSLDEAREALVSLREEVSVAREAVMEISHPEAREVLLDRLVKVDESLDELGFALGQKNVSWVGVHHRAAQTELRRVQETMAAMDSIGAYVSKLKDSQKHFEEEVSKSSLAEREKRQLRERMAACGSLLPGELEIAQRGLDTSGSEFCVAETWRSFFSQRERHFFFYRAVPSMLGAVAIVLGLIMVGVVGVRRRRAKLAAQSQLNSWEEKLDRAGERLIALESTYSGYLSQGKPRYSGQTEDLDRRAADAVNLLFLMYERAVSLKTSAARRFDEALFFQVAVFGECVDLLTVTPVKFETGVAETRLRVFMPLTRSYQGTATALLADLDAQYEEAARLLDQLQRQVEQAFEWGEEIRSGLARVLGGIEDRAEAGFGVEVYSAEMAALEQARVLLAETIVGDPIQANADAEPLAATVGALAARLARGNGALRVLVEDVTPAAQALRAEVRERRESGWKLQEPGFDPDASLDHANMVAREIREALGRHADDVAAELSVRLQQTVAQTQEQVRMSVLAREAIPRELAEQALRVGELERAIPAAREALVRLNAEHAAQTFGVESDNLEELASVLREVATWMERVRAQHQAEAYLAATADADACWSMLEAGLALVREIHDAEARLGKLRDESVQMASACQRLGAQLGAKMNTLGVGATSRAQIQAALLTLPGVLMLQQGERPDWVAAHREVGALQDQLESLEAQAERGIAAAVEARRQVSESLEGFGKLKAQVKAEWRDRPHVERMFDALADELPDYQSNITDASLAGAQMAAFAGELGERVAQARVLWETERDLIHDATAELASTEQRYKKVFNTRYEFNVRAELSQAQVAMEAARSAQDELRWDVVLSQARRAKTLVEAEHAACESRVREQRELRRKAIARSSSYSSSSSSSWSSSRSSSSFGSRSSSFSSSSSWKSSSSGGSSYKSSSGGSSW